MSSTDEYSWTFTGTIAIRSTEQLRLRLFRRTLPVGVHILVGCRADHKSLEGLTHFRRPLESCLARFLSRYAVVDPNNHEQVNTYPVPTKVQMVG